MDATPRLLHNLPLSLQFSQRY